METEVSLDLLETLIEGGNRHVAETWMDILEDQLTKFSVSKHHEEDDDDDEAEEDLEVICPDALLNIKDPRYS